MKNSNRQFRIVEFGSHYSICQNLECGGSRTVKLVRVHDERRRAEKITGAEELCARLNAG